MRLALLLVVAGVLILPMALTHKGVNGASVVGVIVVILAIALTVFNPSPKEPK